LENVINFILTDIPVGGIIKAIDTLYGYMIGGIIMNVKGWNWLKAGVLMGLLNAGFLLFYGKLLGASTAYVSVTGGILKYITPDFVANNPYLKQTPLGFTLEVALMVGVAVGAFIAAGKNRKNSNELSKVWIERYGEDRKKRYIFAFVGGILFILGARLAGGCTSGHVLSGWSQLSVSSLLFGVGMFAAGVPTAKLLFKK
jgi:uncharacterized protein